MGRHSQTDKRYSFIYEDKKGNELFHVYYWFPTLKYSKQFAKILLANSMLADLKRIRVIKAFN